MSLRGARLIDGGILANNPVMVALTESTGPLQRVAIDIKAFSVGTTTDMPRHRRPLNRGGRLKWAPAAVDVLMRAQSDSATSKHDTSWAKRTFGGSTRPCRPGR